MGLGLYPCCLQEARNQLKSRFPTSAGILRGLIGELFELQGCWDSVLERLSPGTGHCFPFQTIPDFMCLYRNDVLPIKTKEKMSRF